jgi:hypothetical protein
LNAVSTGRRAYNILRGYVNREWDRISGRESDSAYAELDAAMTAVPPVPSQSTTPTAADQVALPQIREDRARLILGVAPSANFSQIRKAFEVLNERAAPANFPPGSVEAIKAAEIQKQIHWAYGVLSAKFDSTEKRFGSLEID